jgi:hypothetical protein
MVHATGVVAYGSSSSGSASAAVLLASVAALASRAGPGASPALALPAASSLSDRVAIVFVSSSNISSGSGSGSVLLHVQTPPLCSTPPLSSPILLSWISLDAIFFPRFHAPLPHLKTTAASHSPFNCTTGTAIHQVILHFTKLISVLFTPRRNSSTQPILNPAKACGVM